jgi:hypothetical protein
MIICEQDHSKLEPAACRSVKNSPLQTKYLEKEGKESYYLGELKKNKVWGKSLKSVVK